MYIFIYMYSEYIQMCCTYTAVLVESVVFFPFRQAKWSNAWGGWWTEVLKCRKAPPPSKPW